MEYTKEQIEKIKEELTPLDVRQSFIDSLDAEGEIDVCGLKFYPSQIWEECDPTAFRVGEADHYSMLLDEYEEIDGELYFSNDIAKLIE